MTMCVLLIEVCEMEDKKVDKPDPFPEVSPELKRRTMNGQK
jgi:hypothetical protein